MDKREILEKLARSALGAAPGGSLITEWWRTPMERRKDKWLERFEALILKLEESHGILPEELFERDDFLDVFVEASASVVRTSDERKIKAIENFICNVALEPDIDDAIDSICLRLLSVLSGSHLFILQQMHEKPTYDINGFLPNYAKEPERWELVKEDLAHLSLTGPYRNDGLSETAHALLKRLAPIN